MTFQFNIHRICYEPEADFLKISGLQRDEFHIFHKMLSYSNLASLLGIKRQWEKLA